MRCLLTIFLFIATEASAQIEMFHANNTTLANLILDVYPAELAYSVNKLDKDFTGNAIRVRRSNDNAQQDIGFSGNELDTSSLISFVGSNSAFIVKFYNQGTLGNISNYEFLQNTNSLQPRIVNAGVVEKVNGKPAAYFTGTSGLAAATPGFLSLSRNDIYGVFSTSDTKYLHYYEATPTYFMVAESGSSSTGVSNASGTISFYVNNVLQSSPTRNTLYVAHNGYKISLSENQSGISGTLKFGDYAAFEYTGHVQMILIYQSNQSSNRSNIFSSINSIYSIY